MKDKRTIIAPEAKAQSRRVDVYAQEEADAASIRNKLNHHKRALQNYDAKQEFLYPIERIAQSKIVERNIKFKGADEAYPRMDQFRMRFCDCYYPNAKGGSLYVDMPKNETEAHRAYERHKVMVKLGLRHVILERDTTYEHLLEQLGEF